MAVVIRAAQALLVLAAVAAGITVVAMAVELIGNANLKCSLPYATSGDGAPSAGCAGIAKFQAEATATVAIALAGLTMAVGAAAVGGWVRGGGPRQPRAHSMAGPVAGPGGFTGGPARAVPHTGPQPGMPGGPSTPGPY